MKHQDRQHRIGLLLELCGGVFSFIAVILYLQSVTVPTGSSAYWEGRRIAIGTILLAGPTFLSGLAIQLGIKRRVLAISIAGAGIATPVAVSIAILYPRFWIVQRGTDPSELLFVNYLLSLGLISLSLFLSVRQTTSGAQNSDEGPAHMSRELRRLAARNNELRADSLRARFARYRALSAALMGAGLGVLLIGLIFGMENIVGATIASTLVILGGIGLFTGIFTYYLTPERFVTATVVTAVCRSLDSVSQSMQGEWTKPVYTYDPESGSANEVRLELVSNLESTDRGPITEELGRPRPDEIPGITAAKVAPTGMFLYREARLSLTQEVGSTNERILSLAETLDSPLGLVDNLEATWDSSRLSVRIADSACGPIDRFDHPVVSLLACGLAIETESSVVCETERVEATDFDWEIVCRQVPRASSA